MSDSSIVIIQGKVGLYTVATRCHTCFAVTLKYTEDSSLTILRHSLARYFLIAIGANVTYSSGHLSLRTHSIPILAVMDPWGSEWATKGYRLNFMFLTPPHAKVLDPLLLWLVTLILLTEYNKYNVLFYVKTCSISTIEIDVWCVRFPHIYLYDFYTRKSVKYNTDSVFFLYKYGFEVYWLLLHWKATFTGQENWHR